VCDLLIFLQPADNAANVRLAVECLTDNRRFGFARDRVTVSTVAPSPAAFSAILGGGGAPVIPEGGRVSTVAPSAAAVSAIPGGEAFTPAGIIPEGVPPEGLDPEGVIPEGVMPVGVQPDGVIPGGVLPEGMSIIPEGAPPAEGVIPVGVQVEGVIPVGVASKRGSAPLDAAPALAWSLHAAGKELRRALVPTARFSPEELRDGLCAALQVNI